jgi:hypothetical protein
MKQNNAIRTALGVKREDHVGTDRLLRRSGLPGMVEMSTRANCTMAWQMISENGDKILLNLE